MDPLKTIDLFLDTDQFVVYFKGIINGAREIHNSTSGMTEENKNLEFIVREIEGLSSKLLPTASETARNGNEALCRVAAECSKVANDFLLLLEKIKAKDPKSMRQSFSAAFKNMRHEDEIQELDRRLEKCRSQLQMELIVWSRSCLF